MSQTPMKLFELAALRKGLTAYLDAFEEELLLGTEPRHIERLRVICRMVLEQLVRSGGATLETQAFERRLSQLVAVAEGPRRPSSPPSLRVVH